MLKVDPTLQSNADILQVEIPDTWGPKRTNIKFGPYQLMNTEKGITQRTTVSSDELNLLESIISKHPTDSSIKKMKATHTYQFSDGGKTPWNAHCIQLKVEREVRHKNAVSMEPMHIQYSCEYTRAGSESWVLLIEKQKSNILEARMLGDGTEFVAKASKGVYVKPDGTEYRGLTPVDTGFNWSEDNALVGAVSIRTKAPRVWLHKKKSAAHKNALAMASAGLLIYHWKIAR